uniref:Uncharacterized protein n=1 Tax=Canis lupus familiaris TaxID=9615 RepID=A0A8I3N9G1_CANLF
MFIHAMHAFCPFLFFFFFCPFLNWIIWFWRVLSLRSFFYILDINPSSDMSFKNIFSHSVGCLLVFLLVSFTVQNCGFIFGLSILLH